MRCLLEYRVSQVDLFSVYLAQLCCSFSCFGVFELKLQHRPLFQRRSFLLTWQPADYVQRGTYDNHQRLNRKLASAQNIIQIITGPFI